jgi:hypothetical protein
MTKPVGEPVAVWDAWDPDFYPRYHPQVPDWLVSHGIDTDPAYRVEIYLIDTPFARVYTYAGLPPDDRRYVDPATGEAAVNPPYDHVLSELPPQELRFYSAKGRG